MNILKKFLSLIRFLLFLRYREKILCKIISKEIINLTKLNDKRNINILDYGSGKQPIVIQKIISYLNKHYKNYIFKADCFDFYNKDEINNLNEISNRIQFFDIRKNLIKKKYEFILLIDVLHHVGINNNDEIFNIFNSIKYHFKYLIIKDHFEYNYFSNKLLRIMDFMGNYYNNVSLPKTYYTHQKYIKLISNFKLKEIKRISNIRYYRKFWLFFANPKLQFISILESKNKLSIS